MDAVSGAAAEGQDGRQDGRQGGLQDGRQGGRQDRRQDGRQDRRQDGRQDRREGKREDRRRRLERAALELFATRGYRQTAVEEVVAAAATSKSAFYDFYRSKEDCLRRLLEAQGAGLVVRVEAAAAAGAEPGDGIRRGIRAFVAACAEHAPTARLLLVESVAVSDTIERTRRDLHDRFAAIVGEQAGAAPAASRLARADPGVFARAVVGAVNEITVHLLDHPEEDPACAAEGLCRIFAPDD